MIDKKLELEAYAWAMIMKHGLKEEWSFRWNNRKTAFGLCNYTRKTIELSNYMVDCGESVESMKRTVLHEIAHALTEGAGHGAEWKSKMRSFGLDPKREREGNGVSISYKWFRVCPTCGKKNGYHRKPSSKIRRSCSKCSPVFSLKHLLEVKKAEEISAPKSRQLSLDN
jgi:predicted SprT family Zn-dependent metalloprotease